jgi:hypothetical protein
MSMLNGGQFYTEQKLLGQGNMDELRTRVAGYQHMSANVFKPSFSSDYTNVRSMSSPARAGGGGEEDDEEE